MESCYSSFGHIGEAHVHFIVNALRNLSLCQIYVYKLVLKAAEAEFTTIRYYAVYNGHAVIKKNGCIETPRILRELNDDGIVEDWYARLRFDSTRKEVGGSIVLDQEMHLTAPLVATMLNMVIHYPRKWMIELVVKYEFLSHDGDL
jgi:hypothetical protein